jgi:hypothetical protein
MLMTVDLNAIQLAVRRIDRAIIAWLESDLFPNIVFGCIVIAVVPTILSTLCPIGQRRVHACPYTDPVESNTTVRCRAAADGTHQDSST